MILREQRARAERIYAEQRIEYQTRDRQWRRDTDASVEAFRQEVAPVIKEATTAPVTDVWAAFRQADLFLGEPRDVRRSNQESGATSRPTASVLVALTDGIHTASSQPYQLRSAPEVFVVNSAGEVGALAAMHPQRFESFSAAVRAIARLGQPASGAGNRRSTN
jgi:hypothetical protein